MTHGTLPRIAALILVIAATAVAKPVDAAAGRLTHRAFNYRVTYPANWLRLPVKHADFSIIAPDHNGVFTVTVARGQASTKALLDALKLVYPPLGRPIDPPAFSGAYYGHTVGATSNAFVRSRRGTRDFVIAVALSYRLRLYTMVGVIIDYGMRNQGADVAALRDMITSITLT